MDTVKYFPEGIALGDAFITSEQFRIWIKGYLELELSTETNLLFWQIRIIKNEVNAI